METGENISDFSFELPPEPRNPISFNSSHPEWTGNGFANLSANDIVLIEVGFTGKKVGEEIVVLRWKSSSGSDQSIELGFTVYQKPGEATGSDTFYKNLAKWLGYVSFCLLILVSVLGSRSAAVKKVVMKLFRKQRQRVVFHCIISFVLLVVSITHCLYHFIDQGTLFFGERDIFLGDISSLLMVIISLNGLFQKKLVEAIGYKNWWRAHAGGSIGAIVTALIHIYQLQTIL